MPTAILNPQELLDQLGGRRFCGMTGAKNFVRFGETLQFDLPRLEGIKVNRVRITLEPSDTYTMRFLRRRGTKETLLAEQDDVHAPELCEVFERHTNLLTSL
jgi:hypothetical protein